jgi:hypothetical protein
MKSRKEENRSTASKCKDKAGTRRNMLLVAMVATVAAVIIGSELQVAAADGWGFEDESASDVSLINERESQTVTEPNSVDVIDEDGSQSDESESTITEGESQTATLSYRPPDESESTITEGESPRVTQSYRGTPIIGGELIVSLHDPPGYEPPRKSLNSTLK